MNLLSNAPFCSVQPGLVRGSVQFSSTRLKVGVQGASSGKGSSEEEAAELCMLRRLHVCVCLFVLLRLRSKHLVRLSCSGGALQWQFRTGVFYVFDAFYWRHVGASPDLCSARNPSCPPILCVRCSFAESLFARVFHVE